jgi:phosphodiesterase/alkaline phosphatase D-like protein
VQQPRSKFEATAPAHHANAPANPTLQVEARKLKPNTKFHYQFRYRQNDRTEPV